MAAAAGIVVLALSACGPHEEAATAQAPTSDPVLTTSLERCPESHAATSAVGWAGSVAGVSCEEAGRLILEHFDRDFGATGLVGSESEQIRLSDPGTFQSAGFDCASFPLPDGMGWHMICGRADQEISFYFTP